MGKYDKIKIGEKLPGTYCPLCGEMGLRKMIFDNVVWAICPMIDGKPVVKKLKDAHTGYVISTSTVPAKPAVKAVLKVELDEEKEEGVENG